MLPLSSLFAPAKRACCSSQDPAGLELRPITEAGWFVVRVDIVILSNKKAPNSFCAVRGMGGVVIQTATNGLANFCFGANEVRDLNANAQNQAPLALGLHHKAAAAWLTDPVVL